MPGLRIAAVALGLLAPATARAADTQVTVSAGATHSCALLAPSGRVECWGEGAQGQLGDGTATASTVPVEVSDLAGAISVSAGTDHACAALGDGSVRCWGFATHLYLGAGQVVPAPVPGAAAAVAVSAGAEHDCALQASGGVQCWGAGTHGELGNGATADSARAVSVSGIGAAEQVSAGPGHTCALVAGGQVLCWGRGTDGELGNGAKADSATPVAVAGIAPAAGVSSGANHACAVLADGGVTCWGANTYGQLGDGTKTDSASPVAVSGVSGAVAVSAGGTHTCALLASQAVVCWGGGADGQLGDGTGHDSATPVPVSGFGGARQLSAGLAHTCAAASGPDVGVVCWGNGDRGRLGDGRNVSSGAPVRVLLTVAPPELGRTTTLQRVSGTVRVKPPGAAAFVALGAQSTLPVGTTVDATRGRLRLTSAVDAQGRTQSGLFYSGEFTTAQQTTGLTVLTLTRVSGCRATASAAAAKPPKKKKRPRKNLVWGDVKGNFQTTGRYASATVRGTKWLVEDTCAGTTVRVAAGRVRVENRVTHRTTVVSAGHSVAVAASGHSRSRPHAATSRGFATRVERLLARLAAGRKRLASTLNGALGCSLSPATARGRVVGVIANRNSLRSAASALGAPSARARTVRARLRAAIARSLAADRDYRDWLAGVTGATCPPPRTAAFVAAGHADVQATRAKRRLVAAFNPLARAQHLRTWRAAQL